MNIRTVFLQPAMRFYDLAVKVVVQLQHPFLLAIRLFWGYGFFVAGRGKLMNIGRTTDFFQSLNIPMPMFNAYLVGTVESVGGLLLMLGLFSRLISVPLVINMTVAYLTAHMDVVKTFFSDPRGIGDGFVTAAPFQFLLTAVTVLIFGPGIFSADWAARKFLLRKKAQ